MIGCPECHDTKIVISCAERGGWLIKCNNGHEYFPYPGCILIAYEVQVTPTNITYRNK